MKRGVFLLLIFLITILGINLDVSAYSVSKQGVISDRSCVSSKECILLCSYVQKHTVKKKTYYEGIKIYLNYSDSKYTVEWDDSNSKDTVTVGRYFFNDLLSSTHRNQVYFSDASNGVGISSARTVKEDFSKYAICPTYAYVDTTQTIGNKSQVCFDNDGKWCKSQNVKGVEFGTNEVTTELVYTHEDMIVDYVDTNWGKVIKNFQDELNKISTKEQCDNLKNVYEGKLDEFIEGFHSMYNYNLEELEGKNIAPGNINKNPLYNFALGEFDNRIFYLFSDSEKEAYQSKISTAPYQTIDNIIQYCSKFAKTEEEKEENQNWGSKVVQDAYQNYIPINPDVIGEIEEGDPVTDCEVIPPVIRKWINNILNFVRYVALALVIALGALDFMKAAGSGEPDSFKKAGQSFIKRMIAVIILFLLPYIVDLILNMVELYGVDLTDPACTNINSGT